MLLQYFNFAMDDPAYTLKTASSLTIKPKDYFMRTTLREVSPHRAFTIQGDSS